MNASSSSRDVYERRARWLVCALVLVSFTLSVWRSGAKAIWWDESLSLLRAQSSWRDILINRIHISGTATTDQHPPVYFALLRIVTFVVGQSDTAIRFPSACFTALLVALLYVVGNRLRNPITGLLAAALGSLSPFLLWYAQEARMYTMVAFLGLLSFYLLWLALDKARWTLFLVYGLVLSIGLLTQYLFIMLLPAHFILAAVLAPRRLKMLLRKRWQILLGIAGLSVPVIAAGAVVAMAIQRVPELGSNRTFVPLWMLVRDGFNSFSLGLSVIYEEIWYLDLFFWALYVWGIIAQVRSLLARERRDVPLLTAQMSLLAGYIFIPMLLMWLFSFIAPLYMGSRYLVMCLPAFILSAAIGLSDICKSSRLIALLLFGVILTATTYSLIRYFTDDLYANKEDFRSPARLIAENESSGDVIVVNGSEIEAQFKHYYEGNLRVVPFPLVDCTQQDIELGLAELTSQYDRVWLVEGNKQITDPDELVKAWFRDKALLLGENIFNGYVYPVALSSYYPRPAAGMIKAPERGIGTFGDFLQLDSLSFRYITAAGEYINQVSDLPAIVKGVPAGHTVGIFVKVTVQSRLPILKTSLRLLDKHGRQVAQRDSEPLYYYKTSQWPLGSQVSFQTVVRVPPGTPPGDYQLVWLMYSEDDLGQLAFTFTGQSEERQWLELGTIQVEEGKPYSYEGSLVPDGQTKLAPPARFGPLELQGYHLPETVHAGSDFNLPLYWHTMSEVPHNLELVINWRGSDKHVWGTTYVALDSMGNPSLSWPTGVLRSTLNTLSVPQDAPKGPVELFLMVRQHGTNTYYNMRRGIILTFRDAFRLGTLLIE